MGVTNALAIPSSAPMDTLHPHKDKKRSTRPKSHHEGKHDTTKDIYYTIIDTSIDKWKATKKSFCGDDFRKVPSKNPEETFEQHDSVIKGKRRFSLISKLQENYEKEKVKEVILQSAEVKNNHEIERTKSVDKERSRSVDITTIDTSIDGWKFTKKLTYRGGWKVAHKKSMVDSKQEDAYEEEKEEKVTTSQD
ncbi:uncharacterized protein LOC110435232 isoform X2 [Sorghum bicolor]|uniref:Uncharacterized protein n=1 Tax=Sorghum bicolor TaxID=4558 RepID=A0A1B6PPF2_SORBI|nr:uncharacterized protein LOC110435232 isoform X2 [Sorghum bicolor]KXG27548.1 hypothetical protein SORBI_3005G003100 [Sorghum bicolor]|eukprot:XP_021316298.1 uncharacterized protein LOC110435232 isoform X2 [Sorghum bicolor]